MKTKEELIKGMAEYFEIAGLVSSEAIISANWFYNKIRASIMTPRIVALLKAVGSRPDSCQSCFHCHRPYNSVRNTCEYYCEILKQQSLTDFHELCPLLTADELREVTG